MSRCRSPIKSFAAFSRRRRSSADTSSQFLTARSIIGAALRPLERTEQAQLRFEKADWHCLAALPIFQLAARMAPASPDVTGRKPCNCRSRSAPAKTGEVVLSTFQCRGPARSEARANRVEKRAWRVGDSITGCVQPCDCISLCVAHLPLVIGPDPDAFDPGSSALTGPRKTFEKCSVRGTARRETFATDRENRGRSERQSEACAAELGFPSDAAADETAHRQNHRVALDDEFGVELDTRSTAQAIRTDQPHRAGYALRSDLGEQLVTRKLETRAGNPTRR